MWYLVGAEAYGGGGGRLTLCAPTVDIVQKCRGAIAKSWRTSDSPKVAKCEKGMQVLQSEQDS